MPKSSRSKKYWLDHYKTAKSYGKPFGTYAREHQQGAKRFRSWDVC